MFIIQDYKCGICNITLNLNVKCNKNTHIDHCHTTGKVRGLLCSKCNTGIGMFKENIITLKRAIRYITHHKNQ